MPRTVPTLLALLALLVLPALASELAGPYTDPSYLTDLDFGTHSHWTQPWRAYVETIPAHRFLDGIGMGLNLDREDPDLVLRMLAKNGIRRGRVEIGWGSLDWEDETRIGADRPRALLEACRRWGIRPLILLNAHQGAPCPVRFFERTVTRDAEAGATEVALDDIGGLTIGRSGLSNLSDYWAAEALVTEIDGSSVTLSKPLPKPIAAGTRVPMATLKYRPFSQPGSEDYRESIAGWQRYVAAVAALAAECLGTSGADDLGFDLEVWNELTFGSQFLMVNNYYQPKLEEYEGEGIWGNLVQETCRYIDEHPGDFRGVRITDGFANTIPWTASSREPARVGAISKHPYAGRKTYPHDESGGTARNALGQPDTWVPSYTACFPEYYATALQTETLLRDAAPLTTEIYGTTHGREARPGNPCPVWITEVGYAPSEDGIDDPERALALKAKATARYLVFYLGKGIEVLTLYAASGGDLWLGQVRDSFLEYARTQTEYPADDAPFTSPSLRVIGRIASALSEGLEPDLEETRQVRVLAIGDEHDAFQFAGDGATEHPPLYDRELLVLVPIQVSARRLAIAYYVMTRDIREDLTPEEFTVVLEGLPADAGFTAYDPITDETAPVRAGGNPDGSMTVTLTATDAPRLLFVDER